MPQQWRGEGITVNIKFESTSMKRNIRGIAIAVAVTQLFLVSAAFAQDHPIQTYHIASGPLDRTLVQIAHTSNVRLSYDASLVQSLKSAPVDGSFTPEEAIRHAIAGTGLRLEATPTGGLTIIKTASSEVSSSGTAAGASATGVSSVAAGSSPQPVIDTTLPLISVAAQRDSKGSGYVTESSSTFARTDTPISQTPTSISSVNAAVIQSQNDQNLTDILSNVAGVTSYPSPMGIPSYSVRGFQNAAVLSNGMQTSGTLGLGSANNLTPTIAISSVEVIKGPAAVLAGDAPAGGVINIEKKTPQADPFHEVQVTYGQYGNVIGSLDTTGAITSDNKLMYRFILSDQQGGQNFTGYDGTRNFYFAPTLEWKDSSTDLLVGYDRTVSRSPVPPYTMGFTNGGFLTNFVDHPLGNASDGFSLREDEVYYKLEQKFGQHITFVSRADYTDTSVLQQVWSPLETLSPTYETLFSPFDTTQNMYTASFENYLRAKYDIGPVKTTTLFGWDYIEDHFNEFEWNDGDGILDVPNVYAPPSFPQLTGSGSGLGGAVRGTETQSGFFFQEQANWGRLHVLGSLRNSEYWESGNQQYTDETGAYQSVQEQGEHQDAWTPNLGLLYQLTEDFSAYSNYQRGFVPSSATTFTGSLLSPQKSEQIEVGLKGMFLDDKLSVTTAAYRISYNNQNIEDPEHPGFYLPAGGAVSRGFEVEIAGQVLPGLNVIGQYSYDDYVQPFDPSLTINMPKHSASLWTTYNFQVPTLQGFGVGLGLQFASSQAVGSTDQYRLPSQLQTDMSLFYRRKGYGLNLAVKNVFNRNLYYSSTSPDFISLGTRRYVLLTGTYDF
jgi:iron complex outermembrane recepter protein